MMSWINVQAKNMDIKLSSSLVVKGIVKNVSIAISKGFTSFYINTDQGSKQIIGRIRGKHAAMHLSVKFNDKKRMITVRKNQIKSFQITFHKIVDYDKFKRRAVYYKLMQENAKSYVIS